MLQRDAASGVWRSPLLAALPWIEHGFGGRSSVEWPPEHAAAAKQVHGDHVIFASTPGTCGKGDALVTDAPGLWVGVRTADCVPILLADSRRRLVAAVHAGWRGTVAGIVGKAIEKMGSDARDLHAVLGPAIGICCYEVGEEVASHFGPPIRRHLDLLAANCEHLVAAGVPRQQVDAAAPCTKCGDDFHSYRRDGERAGRMVSAIRRRVV